MGGINLQDLPLIPLGLLLFAPLPWSQVQLFQFENHVFAIAEAVKNLLLFHSA
jgi:hypothetical protein